MLIFLLCMLAKEDAKLARLASCVVVKKTLLEIWMLLVVLSAEYS